MKYSRENIDLIFDVSIIEDVIQDFVPLKKRGANYLGICPFHDEQTPSFTVSPSKGIYKCFGCGTAGNAVNFVMQFKDYSYQEALDHIATKYQLPFTENKIKKEETAIPIPKLHLLDTLGDELDTFKDNSESVIDLMNFDNTVLVFCKTNIEALNERLKNNREVNLANPMLNADNTLKALSSIMENQSMKPQYNSIYNQCIVLLASYFSSSIKQIFVKTIQFLVDEKIPFLSDSTQDIKLSLADLENSNFDLRNYFADYLIDKKNISFQDTKSIARAFKDYFDITIEKTMAVDNIILGLASRHAVVHNMSLSDKIFMNQIERATKRNLKPDIKLFDKIIFTPSEIIELRDSIMSYLENLQVEICNKYTPPK